MRVDCGDEGFNPAGVPANIGPYDCLVVGASFGGPPAVEQLLNALPADFPLPVAVCQHISEGFTAGWAERLSRGCAMPVVEASNLEAFRAGQVYVAPAGRHTTFGRGSRGPYLRVEADYADSLYVPSVDMMLSSAAKTFGSGVLAVILTGLGHDGACGMLAVRRAGGYTIAESSETALSFSMPGSAVSVGAIVETLPLTRLIARAVELGSKR